MMISGTGLPGGAKIEIREIPTNSGENVYDARIDSGRMNLQC